MKTTQCSSGVLFFLLHHHHHRGQFPSPLSQFLVGRQCLPPSAYLTTSAAVAAESTNHFLHICRSRRWDSNAESYMSKNSDVNFDADEEEENEDIMELWDANLQEFLDSMWIFKVFRSYGLLLPFIILSMLLANGPKAFLLALALPVGQSTFSFAIQKMREEQMIKPRQNTKTKKRSHTRSSISFEEESRMQNQRNRNANKARESWGGPKDNASTDKKVGKNAPSYGGWDELVDIGREYIVDSSGNTDQTAGRSYKRSSQMGELNSKMRKSERPLLLRLLMSVFPFLDSWI